MLEQYQIDAILIILERAKNCMEDSYDVSEWPASGDTPLDHSILEVSQLIADLREL